MVEQTSQTEMTELPASKEKDLLDRVKKIVSPFKGDRWLSVAVYGLVTTVGLIIGVLIWNLVDLQTNPSEQSKRKFDASLSVVSTGATVTAGVVLFLNFRVAKKKLDEDLKKAERDEKLAQSRLTMERFSKAVEMLGKNDSIHLRLGGIYALESIADDSNEAAPDENYRQVLEVLTAFVRENAPYPPKEQTQQAETQATLTEQSPEAGEDIPEAGEDTKEELLPLPTDIQAVLTVLKRRKHKDKDWEQYPLDLRKTDLRRAHLESARLQRAQLESANLKGANLWLAKLQGADLESANFQKADLLFADLRAAHLWSADFQGADLESANLQGADLELAKLQQANIRGANLQGVSFWNTHSLRLTGNKLVEAKNKAKANIQSAQNWEMAMYDAEIHEWLKLPPENLQVE